MARLPVKPSRIFTVTNMETVAIAVKEMSIPPESITTKTPMAIVPMMELLFSTSKMFSSDRKEELMLFTIRAVGDDQDEKVGSRGSA